LSATRRFEVDLLKAVGIVGVVLIHCIRPSSAADVSVVEAQIGMITRFAVPGFLAASGYLYALSRPASGAVTRRRLRRILLPYLVASAAAQLFWIGFEGRVVEPRALVEQIVLGSSFGPYYYVLIAALCALLAPLLSPLGARALAFVTAASLVAQGLCWAFQPLPMFWALRNPFYWLGFFVAGWWLGTQQPAATRWLASRRLAICAASGAGFVATRIIGPGVTALAAAKTLLLVSVWCALFGILALGVGRSGEHRIIRPLSDATFTIYLFHLFFVLPLQRLLPAAAGVFDPVAILVPWLAGLLGPLALAAASRALLGPRSRTILGA
jgi:surface polysaccharide O-acyltransferase-like enzyme